MSVAVVSNVAIANQIRGLQEDMGLIVPASSTLLRLKKEALIAKRDELAAAKIAFDSANLKTDEAEFQVALDNEGVDSEKTEEEAAQAAMTGEVPVASSKRRGAKPLQADDMVITVLVASNPKRDGSATAARFGLMQSGMTVGEYVAAVVASTGTNKRARRTLRKAVAAGQVAVNHPSTEG